MRVLVISDTHGYEYNLEMLLQKEEDFDLAIHLGDVEGGYKNICQMLKCPLEIVKGNNDYDRDIPREKEITVGKYRVMLTHGHYYYLYMDTEVLAKEARSRGCQIAMYGHTHRPKVEKRDGMLLLNPGSLTYPRQNNRKPSYIVLELSDDGKIDGEIRYLDEE